MKYPVASKAVIDEIQRKDNALLGLPAMGDQSGPGYHAHIDPNDDHSPGWSWQRDNPLENPEKPGEWCVEVDAAIDSAELTPTAKTALAAADVKRPAWSAVDKPTKVETATGREERNT